MSKSKFKVGSLVNCVARGCNRNLTLNKIYILLEINGTFLYIIDDSGLRGGYLRRRFELVYSKAAEVLYGK